MGQRLNIEIHSGDNVLANAYYHWSGYTRSSIELAKRIVADHDKVQEENQTLRAIRLLELTGARLTNVEIEHAKSVGLDNQFEPADSRNAGLIAISEKGMAETQLWEEARVTIDLADNTVTFDALWSYLKEEYVDNYSQEEYEKLGEWSHDQDPTEPMSFEALDAFSQYIDDTIDGGSYTLKFTKDDEPSVVGFIE